ncbi:FeoB-associated Cys-rich membrane protein [Flavobacterium sp.]
MASLQEILVYVALGIAIGFLAQKFIGKKKSKKGCDKDDCGCH